MTDEEKKDYIQELIYDFNDPQCMLLEKDKLEFFMNKALEKGLKEGRISTIERYAQIDRATIISEETLEIENEKLKKENKLSEYIIIGEQQEINRLEKENAELKAQIEKMKNIIYEEVDFCSYCPLKECKNDEGACPYEYLSEEEQKKILVEWITENRS